MAPANYNIGLKVEGKHRGLEVEPIISGVIPDSPPRKHSEPEELTTIYKNGSDVIGAKTVAGNGEDILSPTTFLQHKQGEKIVDAHLVQGDKTDYREFGLQNGRTVVIRTQRT